MLTTLLLLAAAACPQGQSNPRVVINEFQYDDNTTDDYEFIELYNKSAAPVDISGWTVELTDFDATTQIATLYATFTVPAGTSLAPGGFWLMGSAVFTTANQNIGTTSIIRDELGCLVLKDNTGTIEDTVFKETNKGTWANQPPREGPGLWGNHRSGREDMLFSSWARLRDGYDTNNNGRDFLNTTATPGTTNNRATILPVAENFDLLNLGAPIPQFGGSFKEVRVTDPTVSGNFNPNVIVASPQGGFAGIAWDESGGGNSNQLLSDIGDNFVIESWVYFDTTPVPAGELDAWSVGASGTCDSFYNLPDPDRVTTRAANGNTGVSWTLVRTSVETALFLVDHNDGGADWTVLGKIVITPGVNDGWRRLRLQVTGNFAEGRFGGTLGGRDGTLVAGRVQGALGGVYIGYRELLTNNALCRPFTCDDLSIRVGSGSVEYYGPATPTTVATPVLTPAGFPLINNPSFSLDFSGLVPNSLCVFFIASGRLSPGVPLSPFGAPPGSELLVPASISVNVQASAQGRLSIPAPLPLVPSLVGTSLAMQLFNADPALPFALPIGHTTGVELTFGN